MVKHRKALLVGGGALLAIAGGYQLMNLQQLNKELQIEQNVSVYRVNLSGITIRIELILKNPTPGEVSVKTPNVTLSYNGQQLGSSDVVSGANHRVPAYGQVALEPIDITLGFMNLALNARTFFKAYGEGKAKVTVRAITRINDVFPVEKVSEFDLGSSTPAGGKKTIAGLPGRSTSADVPEAFDFIRVRGRGRRA